MLDFRYESFLVLYKLRSYTKTATQLFVTQPTISQHIRLLEDKYQLKLFTYQGKQVRPTKAADALYHYLSLLKTDCLHFEQAFSARAKDKPSLHIGATLSIGEYVMPQVLKYLIPAYPSHAMHLHVNNTHTLLTMLQGGHIQFALIEGDFNKAEYEWQLLSTQPFVCVCGPASPLADQKVSLESLFAQRLFLREEGSGTRERLNQMLKDHHFSLDSFEQQTMIGNMSAIKTLVSSGLGITFMYQVAVEKELKEKSLCLVRIKDIAIQRDFHFVSRKGSRFYEEVDNWLQHILMVMSQGTIEP